MSAIVVDCNVIVAANRLESEATVDCQDLCVDLLDRATRDLIVVVDDARLILDEYGGYADASGQGVGDAFLRHLNIYLFSADRCERVQLTLRDRNVVGETPDDADFEQFPDSPALKTFDRSDRKYVAVACASTSDPALVYASDRGWRRHEEALKSCGIRLRGLCPGRT